LTRWIGIISLIRSLIKANTASTRLKGTKSSFRANPEDVLKARSHLKDFFKTFPEFNYNPNKPYMEEFYRMTNQFKWNTDSNEFKKARQGINTASVLQFNSLIGKDEHALAAWHMLFRRIKGEELPETVKQCRQVSEHFDNGVFLD
jgi:hypothetical protein